MKHFLKIFSILTLSMLLGNFSAFAEDCHRGTLDKAYCDRNMDQVADLPLDSKDWVDTKTIIFKLFIFYILLKDKGF